MFPKQVRVIGYMYLFELAIPLAFALGAGDAAERIGGVAAILLLGAVYVYSFWCGRRMKHACVAAEIAIMMFVMWYINPAFIWLLMYPASLMGVNLHRRALPALLTAAAAAGVAESFAWSAATRTPLGYNWLSIAVAAFVAYVVAFGTSWQTRVLAAKRELEMANSRIERLTIVAERERISQDLHDVMGHDLSVIALKAQLVGRLVDRDPARAKGEARDIELAARQALARVREYIADMRQPAWREEWESAVRAIRAADIACLEEDLAERLPECPATAALAMCLREAATNLIRHSRASRASLRAFAAGGGAVAIVADDGSGIGGAQAPAQGATLSGRGLPGMLARMAAVGGRAGVWSNGRWVAGGPFAELGACPGPFASGTAVCLFAPVAQAAADASAAPCGAPDDGAGGEKA